MAGQQKPISRYDEMPTSSQKTKSWMKLRAVTNPSIEAVNIAIYASSGCTRRHRAYIQCRRPAPGTHATHNHQHDRRQLVEHDAERDVHRNPRSSCASRTAAHRQTNLDQRQQGHRKDTPTARQSTNLPNPTSCRQAIRTYTTSRIHRNTMPLKTNAAAGKQDNQPDCQF